MNAPAPAYVLSEAIQHARYHQTRADEYAARIPSAGPFAKYEREDMRMHLGHRDWWLSEIARLTGKNAPACGAPAATVEVWLRECEA